MTVAALKSGDMQIVISDEVAGPRFAHVQLSSAIGSASSRVHGLELAPFLVALAKLDETLKGQARLEGIEGDFRLDLKAGRLGHLDVEARISDLERSSDFYVSGQVEPGELSAFLRSCRSLELESVTC